MTSDRGDEWVGRRALRSAYSEMGFPTSSHRVPV